MSRLLIYDTSNFIDFPIGGQLTSIGNFLLFLVQQHPERIQDIVLVGISRNPGETGRMKQIRIHGGIFNFFPVTDVPEELSNMGQSLRLRYVKGLLKYKRLLKIKRGDCHYIHTPEAYGLMKLFSPGTSCVVYSHGSYFNMEKGFRFFRNNLLVKKAFVFYLKWLIRSADLIFVIDKISLRQYENYHANVQKICNSIVCPQLSEECHRRSGEQLRILFVGRLSKDKRVEPVIQCVKQLENAILTIVGDGEEYDKLIPYEGEKIHFTGAVKPQQVKDYMQNHDILVMNSAFEGVPMTILEALSYGIPVVSTNVGGIGEALSFGQDSEESDGTPESIGEAILRIGESYERYSRNAYLNSRQFDYTYVNKSIYDGLSNYWRETK